MIRTCSIGCPFQNLSDACIHLPRMLFRASVRRWFVHLLDTCTRIHVRALGGNVIITHTVYMHSILAGQNQWRIMSYHLIKQLGIELKY